MSRLPPGRPVPLKPPTAAPEPHRPLGMSASARGQTPFQRCADFVTELSRGRRHSARTGADAAIPWEQPVKGSDTGGYVSTLILADRRWLKPGPARAPIASARVSYVGRRAGCTVPQGTCAACPCSVRPPGICTTAEPRPIVAILPLSRYLKGFVSLPSTSRSIVSPA